MRQGQLNEEVASIMRLNVRVPDQNWGDFKAQLASVNVGERKIHDIIARFGIADFLQGIEGILDYAEAQARSIIKTIPDGEYFYADYADEDGEGGYPCRIADYSAGAGRSAGAGLHRQRSAAGLVAEYADWRT